MDFENLQNQIQSFINEISSREDIFFRQEKLSVSDAIFCAEDTVRNRKFYEATQEAVSDAKQKFPKENIHVIDAGAGLGILGIYALIHGAKKVTFIEENELAVKLLKEFLEKIGYLSRSNIIQGDATKLQNLETAHILMSETITIDFESEDFLEIISHMKQFLHDEAIIIPEKFEIDYELDSGKKHIDFSSYDSEVPDLPSLSDEQNYALSGRCYLYKNIYLNSGDTLSFFNGRKSSYIDEE